MEIDYYRVLGLEAPAEAPVQTDGAGAAEPEPAGGENEQDIAEPASAAVPDQLTDEAGTTPAEEAREAPDTTPEQLEQLQKAERARQAQARRAREREQAVQAAKDEQRQAFNELLAKAGIMNRLSGDAKKIETIEDLEQYITQRDGKKLEQDLAAGRLTPETIEEIVAQNPTLQRMQDVIAQTEQTAQAAAEARDRARIADELKEISRLDPEVSSLEDILQMDTAEEFQRLVREKGMSFLDAYKLANFERLSEKRAAAAKQSAVNLANSKNHLSASQSRGSGGVEVPADVMREYRMLMPDATDAQIRAAYGKYLKDTKRS